jgi:hypothetical protein
MWQKIQALILAGDEPGDKVYVLAVSKKNFRNMKIASIFQQDMDSI